MIEMPTLRAPFFQLPIVCMFPLFGIRDAAQKGRSLELPEDSYSGQVVCVTGSTTGLGLAAAIHFANLGADEVIITCRDSTRGQKARERIQEATKATQCRITVLELDMNRFASVVAFVNNLKKIRAGHGGIDYICLNAGVYPTYHDPVSPEGWPQVLQVNFLSTILIALLLLPWMMGERENRLAPAHLSFVSSIAHVAPGISQWPKWAASDGILAHYQTHWTKRKWKAYGLSKLMLNFVEAEMVKRIPSHDGSPAVIVNSVCPGVVATDIFLTRQPKAKVTSRFNGPLKLMAKSAENGAGIMVMAGLATPEDQGQFLTRYVSPKEYQRLWNRYVASEKGQRMQARLWDETVEILGTAVPELRDAVKKLGD